MRSSLIRSCALALGGVALAASGVAGTAVASPAPAPAPNSARVPATNQDIYPVKTFFGGDGVRSDRARLIFQQDGNLVVYDENGVPRWASHTVGSGHSAVFQQDGNFVVYTDQDRAVWASNTNGRGSRLSIQDDGNVVIYDSAGNAVWSTNTQH